MISATGSVANIPMPSLPLDGRPRLAAALGEAPRRVHSSTVEWMEGGAIKRNSVQLFREVVADVPAGISLSDMSRRRFAALGRLATLLDRVFEFGEMSQTGAYRSMAGVKAQTGHHFTPTLHRLRMLVLRPLVLVDREYTDFVGERRRAVEFIVELALEVTGRENPTDA